MVFLPPGGDRGQRCGRKVLNDPEVLQGHLHNRVQEDHRSRLPREENLVGQATSSQYKLDDFLEIQAQRALG